MIRQIEHYEQCIDIARQNVAALEQALISLNCDPFSLPIRISNKETERHQTVMSMYAHRPSEFIAKVLKRYPNEWLSTKEIMFKVFELKGDTPDESAQGAIISAFSQALGRLHEKGIIEKSKTFDGMPINKNRWKLKAIKR